jgi:hypothetical protein
MIHTDEDDEFDRIAHEAKMKGQPYYFKEHPTDPEKVIFRKPSRKLDDDDIQEYVRPWVGLTDEEIEDAIDDGFAFGLDDGNVSNQTVIRYVRVIEAKLKEKNT